MLQRTALGLFLVVLVPMGVFWAGNGLAGPGDTYGLLADQTAALRGTPPPAKEPEPGASVEPDGGRPDPRPEADAVPEPEPADPRLQADELFKEGRYADAAALATGRRRALAQLGAAFAEAFRPSVPELPYQIVRTAAGHSFEGFVDERGGRVRLSSPTGRSITFPPSVLAHRTTLSREDAIQRIVSHAIEEGMSDTITGARLFSLVHELFAVDRPQGAAPLLPRLLELDDEKPFFLSSVRNRVPAGYQHALYRAFSACQVPDIVDERELNLVRTPRRLGNGSGRMPRPQKTSVLSPKARRLMAEAAPLRRQGERIYKKIVLAGLDRAQLDDIEKAIGLLERADGLYEKAILIEESDELYAIARRTGKILYALRFARQQVEGR